jgi:hypothetical protein
MLPKHVVRDRVAELVEHDAVDGQRRGRAGAGFVLQAAQDHPFDGRVDVFHDR